MKFTKQILFLLAFIALLVVVIIFARGYRINIKEKTLQSTGIISIHSIPKTAKVYINDELKGVSDLNLTLSPGQYKIEVKKDGYTQWKKTIILKGELVISEEALLFPLNPSLSPLTNLGITKAVPLGKRGETIVFIDSDHPKKDGIYLFDSNKSNFSLSSNLKLIISKTKLLEVDSKINFDSSEIVPSPDYSQIVFSSGKKSYLLSLREANKDLFDITPSKKSLVEAWKKEKTKENLKILETFPKDIYKIATSSFEILSFSPDENKLLYRSKKKTAIPLIKPTLLSGNQTKEQRDLSRNGLYVYDKREDRNYQIYFKNTKFRGWEKNIIWHPDSKHLFINKDKKITAIDYDGTNPRTVYSGPFESSFFLINNNGDLVSLTNLNPEVNKFPDLYLIGLK